ncbi:uncharacterized protein LOC125225743 [Leguminivora glycinivorella]|uniref:uncharacterized protein LOC125225743 n=1 Tax=Leguminivora glycinivorella TaxID=1035111 RepID=UPI00200DBDCA|nr:uncharacterized protein LOC125225743 [Leguminivora glycinivorella]
MHPVKFGQFLYTNGISNLKDGGIKKIGRNRLSVEFLSAAGANQFLSCSLASNNCKKFIPSYHVTKTGIARNIPTDLSNEDLPNLISTPFGCGKVVKARRLNFKKRNPSDNSTQWAPSETVVLTFDGQILPDKVFLFSCALDVVQYYFPTVQCFKCCRFGHVRAQCRSRPRCSKCAQPHEGSTCSAVPSCLNCLGKHCATDKVCSEFIRQQQIKRIMGDESLSYQEADRKIPKARRPYNEAAQTKSYKKTVLIQKKTPALSNPHGYDEKSHRALVADYNAPQPANGVMFRNGPFSSQCSSPVAPAPTELFSLVHILPMLYSVISSLVSTLQQNAISLPSNVASSLKDLSPFLSSGPVCGPYENGGQFYPVEHQEHQS